MKTNVVAAIVIVLAIVFIFILTSQNAPTPIASYPNGVIQYSCEKNPNFSILNGNVVDESTGASCAYEENNVLLSRFNLGGTIVDSLDGQKYATVKLVDSCNFSKFDFLVLEDGKNVYECSAIQGV